ncbi:MAG: hypothetical protein ACO1OG_05040 [Devosia sp.]
MDYKAIQARNEAEWKALQQFAVPYVAAIRAIVREEFETPPEQEDRVVRSFCEIVLGTVRSSDIQEAAWIHMWKVPGKIVTDRTTWEVTHKLRDAKLVNEYGHPRRPSHIPWKYVP